MAVPMPCEPDYETIIARKKGDLEVLKNFQTSLTDFIKAIGNNALTLNGIKFFSGRIIWKGPNRHNQHRI